MMSTKEVLEELLSYKHETIQPSTFLGELDGYQSEKFKDILSCLGENAGENSKRKANLVFRGEKLKNLAERLSTNPSSLDEDKIAKLLFYFGEKARLYYRREDTKALELRVPIRQIEDVSDEIVIAIFERTQEFLAKPYGRKFKRANKSFAKFFSTENKDHFCSQLRGDQTARDYYLFFLHTAGEAGIRDNSVLVSTSLSNEQAYKFSGSPSEGCIIYYVIPEPLDALAVSHLRMVKYEPKLTAKGLPTYKTTALKPEEEEIAVRGALFASFMLGLKICRDNRFIVNPHLFNERNTADSILKGLTIPDSDFEQRLEETGYAMGVGTVLNGSFHTILKADQELSEHS